MKTRFDIEEYPRRHNKRVFEVHDVELEMFQPKARRIR